MKKLCAVKGEDLAKIVVIATMKKIVVVEEGDVAVVVSNNL